MEHLLRLFEFGVLQNISMLASTPGQLGMKEIPQNANRIHSPNLTDGHIKVCILRGLRAFTPPHRSSTGHALFF